MEIRIVKTKWVVGVPNSSKVKVKEGEMVVAGQDLVEVKTYEEEVVDVSREMGMFPVGDRDKLKESMLGKNIVAGEILWQTKGLFAKKIEAKFSGEILKFDEFNNMYIKLPGEKIKITRSPVNAKVSKVGDGKMVLEFRATEYPGEGLTDGKTWGKEGIRPIKKISDLSVSDEGRVIIAESLSEAMLLKAEVVGVLGVVTTTLEKGDRIKSRLPILALEMEGFEKLLKTVEGKKYGVLLNATAGRLLLVSQK
jgi:hypothetical protein